MTRGAALVVTAAAVVLCVCACTSARRGEIVDRPLDLSDPAAARGAIVYMASCHKCHPGGEAGLGPALNDKPLPEFMERLQIRHGLGVMPSFSEDMLDPQELDDLVAYIAALRDA